MMESFRQWHERRHEYAARWKEKTGGKILGYFCTYFPQEILYAADVLPVRIMGTHGSQDESEPHGLEMTCPHCRDRVAQGLEGRYDYLDGIGIAQSCAHLRESFASWRHQIPLEFEYCLPLPDDLRGQEAATEMRAELTRFKLALEKWLGREIGDEDLRRGIDIVDANRRLMRKVYELRKQETPRVSGLEAMTMVVAGQMVDMRDHSTQLLEIMPRLEHRDHGRATGKRLMLVGFEDDDTTLLEMIESLDATIVADEHCAGSRFFWNTVGSPGGDPLTSIAQRYLERPACPSKDRPARTRIPHLLQLAQDFRVQGALLVQQRSCNHHELDAAAIEQALQEQMDIPSLLLEVEGENYAEQIDAFLGAL